MTQPFISVRIDTYNHEMIAIDDGSVDQTADRVRRFEARVGLIRKTNSRYRTLRP